MAPGMTVIVRHDYLTGEKADKDWWMEQVIHCGGGARNPKIHNLFQIANVDSGVMTNRSPSANQNRPPSHDPYRHFACVSWT